MRPRSLFLIVALIASTTLATSAQTPQKTTVEGVRNFTVVDPIIGCAGATEVAAIPGLAARGYKSMINLREATEAGANVEESRSAATAAGLRYIHLPLNGAKPDPAVADAFLAALADRANQPAFIHCGSANRVGGLMMAKRMLVDGWTEAKAYEEAAAIGLTSPVLRQFAVDYVASKKK